MEFQRIARGATCREGQRTLMRLRPHRDCKLTQLVEARDHQAVRPPTVALHRCFSLHFGARLACRGFVSANLAALGPIRCAQLFNTEAVWVGHRERKGWLRDGVAGRAPGPIVSESEQRGCFPGYTDAMCRGPHRARDTARPRWTVCAGPWVPRPPTPRRATRGGRAPCRGLVWGRPRSCPWRPARTARTRVSRTGHCSWRRP